MGQLKGTLRSATLLVGLSACSGTQYVQAIDYKAISAVEAEIKRQIGVYIAASALPPVIRNKDGKTVYLPTDSSFYQCGSGKVGFDILSVKADLIATTENTADGKLSISAPVTPVTLWSLWRN